MSDHRIKITDDGRKILVVVEPRRVDLFPRWFDDAAQACRFAHEMGALRGWAVDDGRAAAK